jgi:hypothetical protein
MVSSSLLTFLQSQAVSKNNSSMKNTHTKSVHENNTEITNKNNKSCKSYLSLKET